MSFSPAFASPGAGPPHAAARVAARIARSGVTNMLLLMARDLRCGPPDVSNVDANTEAVTLGRGRPRKRLRSRGAATKRRGRRLRIASREWQAGTEVFLDKGCCARRAWPLLLSLSLCA